MGQYNGKRHISLVYVTKLLINVTTVILQTRSLGFFAWKALRKSLLFAYSI